MMVPRPPDWGSRSEMNGVLGCPLSFDPNSADVYYMALSENVGLIFPMK